MKSICLFFQVHQPFRHRRYRFFDIGNDHYYYDDYANATSVREIVDKSYLPANKLLLKLIKKMAGKFRVSFSITGTALDQFELYAPKVIESFQKLAATSHVEFLTETYSHSLSSLKNRQTFENQVRLHEKKIFELFGQKPKVFRNTEMIYSDEIGAQIFQMGYKAMLTEGARHVLGWKSPNFLYVNAQNPRLKVLMRNFKLSDDLALRFSNPAWSEYPLTAGKFTGWLNGLDDREEVVNLFLGYDSLGKRHPEESGIFEFMEHWVPDVLKQKNFKFSTPSQVIEELQPVSVVSVPNPISWVDEERDLTAWLGNDMQREAFGKLYDLSERISQCVNSELLKDWNYLQSSDHFHYMSTKFFSHGESGNHFNPFESPFEAFINYMNVLSDFKLRLKAVVPESKLEYELAGLHKLVEEKENRIKKLEGELHRLQKHRAQTKSVKRK